MADTDFTLTKDYLHQIFEYRDGFLYWKIKVGGMSPGDKAGSTSVNNGRTHVQIKRKFYKVHRIIFMMFYGYIPKEIDHADTNESNNKIENLREATSSQNNYNQKLRKDNTSGIKGVTWDKSRQKWHVQVVVNKKPVFQARFDDLELAELVAQEARDKYHGKFARHN